MIPTELAMQPAEVMLSVPPRMWAEVHLDHLQHNVREIRKRLRPDVRFMAVVKADGYGHGVVQAAQAAIGAGAESLAVNQCEEAAALRQAGITAPILVLSPIHPAQVDVAAELELEVTVFQASWLSEMRRWKKSRKTLLVHIKMDTGMGRYGLQHREEFEAMLPGLMADDIRVVGVYTHFATANQEDDSYVRQQFAKFMQMRGWLEEAGLHGVIAHCANSATALRFPEFALDMVRVGASLYGILPVDGAVAVGMVPVRLKPTLSIRTAIAHIKRVERGQTIGYDRSYTASADEWIATLPVGYADGWYRGYGGCEVLAGGERVPIVGNICMNQTMIRLPRSMPIGTVVTLIGEQLGDRITLDELAAHIGSIPQQVLVMLPRHMQRVYTGLEDEMRGDNR
jgi:alanine racemase